MIYKPEGFELYELLPKDFYEQYYPQYGEKLWLMFDQRMLWTQEQLRKIYGTTVMNTWWWGGNNQYRGWRPWPCLDEEGNPIGAELSQHKFGRAGDSKFKHYTAEEVRKDIKKDPWRYEFRFITCLEEDVSWLHQDCRAWDKQRNGLLLVNG